MKAKETQLMLALSAVGALLFVASLGPALAQNVVRDLQGDVIAHPHFSEQEQLANLDIAMYGFAGKSAYIMVYGTAGGTLPEHDEEDDGFGHAIAYVLDVVTTAEGEDKYQTWAIDSHEAQHGESGLGEVWHAHRVVVDEFGCLNEIDHVNPATVKNKHVWFENMVVRGKSGNLETVDAIEILAAKTVLLEVLVADPDNPPEGTECIAIVDHVFDEA